MAQPPTGPTPAAPTAGPHGTAGAPGTRPVRYEWCFSVGLATVRRRSRVVVGSRRGRVVRGLPYSALALLLGPWGVPWGLVLTARAVWVNTTGGADPADDPLAPPGDTP